MSRSELRRHALEKIMIGLAGVRYLAMTLSSTELDELTADEWGEMLESAAHFIEDGVLVLCEPRNKAPRNSQSVWMQLFSAFLHPKPSLFYKLQTESAKRLKESSPSIKAKERSEMNSDAKAATQSLT